MSTCTLCATLWRYARTAPDIKNCTDIGASWSVPLAAHHLHKKLCWPQRLYGPNRLEKNSASYSNITRGGQAVPRRPTDYSHRNVNLERLLDSFMTRTPCPQYHGYEVGWPQNKSECGGEQEILLLLGIETRLTVTSTGGGAEARGGVNPL